MDKYQQLFDTIDKIGECLEGELHIIDTTDLYPVEGEKSYRVYHKKGICFDVRKEVEIENEETGEVIKWNYEFYAEWEGFDELTLESAIDLLKEVA